MAIQYERNISNTSVYKSKRCISGNQIHTDNQNRLLLYTQMLSSGNSMRRRIFFNPQRLYFYTSAKEKYAATS